MDSGIYDKFNELIPYASDILDHVYCVALEIALVTCSEIILLMCLIALRWCLSLSHGIAVTGLI